MIPFFDFIRGGSSYNQGAPVAGDGPSDGAKASDIRGIFSALSDEADGVLGVINSFKQGSQPNKQTPAVGVPSGGGFRFMPIIIIAVVGLGLWWFLRRK